MGSPSRTPYDAELADYRLHLRTASLRGRVERTVLPQRGIGRVERCWRAGSAEDFAGLRGALAGGAGACPSEASIADFLVGVATGDERSTDDAAGKCRPRVDRDHQVP